MQFITTVTQKGQITLPKKVRDKLGIDIYSKVYLQIEDDKISIKPAEDILDLAGRLKPKIKKPILSARDVMESGYKRF